jgi:DNA-binding MarR family transcriptional regulator
MLYLLQMQSLQTQRKEEAMSVIVRHLTAISRCGSEYRKKYLEPVGMDARHARFLFEICDKPGISQEGLARRLLVDKSTVARMCAVLEENGYILRQICTDDRRITRVHPTEKTLALFPQIQEAWTTWEARITQDLTPEEIETLTTLLRKMKVSARAWIEEG